MFTIRRTVALALAAGLLVLGASCEVRQSQPSSTRSQENPPAAAQAASPATAPAIPSAESQIAPEPRLAAADAAKKDAVPAKTAPKDRYQLPDGGVKELLAFIKEIRTFQPTTEAEADEHREKALPALKAAAQKVMEIAKDDDKKLEGFDDVPVLLLMIRTAEIGQATPEEQKQLIADLKARITVEKPGRQEIAAAMQAASTLEDADPELGAEAYRELGAALAKSDDPQIAKAGAKMEGAARRLTLMGNPLEITGTQVDGSKFDWEQYRGKVVLVDFWATWCGPCRAELPNVKENYKQYHDQGFDVVGISLDDERDALDKLLAEEKNPWVTLHDGGWDENANATRYGVMGIPTVILVDKEGKVVSTNARGPELGKLLESLLGPPKSADEAK